MHDNIRAVDWVDGAVRLLDQRRLPHQQHYCELRDAASVARAITDMVVRGAPAIGVCAAYAAVLAAQARHAASSTTWRSDIDADLALLAAARPTAVNLDWALACMRAEIGQITDDNDPGPVLLAAARRIHAGDVAANRAMGEAGSALLAPGSVVLTHCNTGSLATGGYGTALGVIRAAFAAGRIAGVYAGETRPWLQGARLTAWELAQDGIPVTLLADGAAAHLIREKKVDWVIVGADRVAANGDFANKIGTFGLAVSAHHLGARFMVVAPSSTIDLALAQGADIPIEMRAADEVLALAGQPVAAAGALAWNPAFDVTPAELVDALVTEKGVVLKPTRAKLAALMRGTDSGCGAGRHKQTG